MKTTIKDKAYDNLMAKYEKEAEGMEASKERDMIVAKAIGASALYREIVKMEEEVMIKESNVTFSQMIKDCEELMETRKDIKKEQKSRDEESINFIKKNDCERL